MKIYAKTDEGLVASIDMITGEIHSESDNISNIETTNYLALREYKKKFGITFPFLTDGNIITIADSSGFFEPYTRNDLTPIFQYEINDTVKYMSLLIQNMIIKPQEESDKITFNIRYNNEYDNATIEHDSNDFYLCSKSKINNWILKELHISDKKIESILRRTTHGIWPYGTKEEVCLLIDYINSNYSNNKSCIENIIGFQTFFFNNHYYEYKQSKKNGWYIEINLKLFSNYLHIPTQDVRAKLCEYSNNKIGIFPEFKTKEDLINGLKRLLDVH